MSLTRRFAQIEPLDIIALAAAAETLGPDVLRMENLDTDLAPPRGAIEATTRALDDLAHSSSYLPFTGKADLRSAIARRLEQAFGICRDPESEVVVGSGGLACLLAALLATVDAGDRVVVTDPCYAGIIHRVRLTGAEPVFVPLRPTNTGWRLDIDAMDAIDAAAAIVTMSPSMPTGHMLDEDEWDAVARLVQRTGAQVIHDAAMERIVFDGHAVSSPLTHDALSEHAIIVSSVAKEYRMVGWRVGWVAAPQDVLRDIASAVIYSTVVPSGFAQAGAHAALIAREDGIEDTTCELQARRDQILGQLSQLAVSPDGGWSLLVDAVTAGTDARTLSAALLKHGRVAATPMNDWGPSVAPRYVRLVFAREPLPRLSDFGQRVSSAIAATRV